MSKDYYKTLGVGKSATKDEIKKAYKRLAKQYHPDMNKDSEAAERFKEINEAAAVLGNDKKREQYDQFGEASFNQGGFDFSGFSSEFDFGDIFDQFFGGNVFGNIFGKKRASGSQGSDLVTDLYIDLKEAVAGVKKKIVLKSYYECEACYGRGSLKKSSVIHCEECNGRGYANYARRTPFGLMQTTTTCKSCGGTGETIKEPCSECNGAGSVLRDNTVEVKVPAGVDEGTKLKIKGAGSFGRNSGAGDLYVLLHVREDPSFERDGDDLNTKIALSFTALILGSTIEVSTLLGKTIKLKIPAGTQPGTVFRIKSEGVPHLGSYGAGYLNVEIGITIPEKISKRQEALLREFEENSKKGWLF